jgi:hypothetical protein
VVVESEALLEGVELGDHHVVIVLDGVADGVVPVDLFQGVEGLLELLVQPDDETRDLDHTASFVVAGQVLDSSSSMMASSSRSRCPVESGFSSSKVLNRWSTLRIASW